MKKIDMDEFSNEFWSEYCKLVPEHLRANLSCHHVRFMIKAFFTTYRRLEQQLPKSTDRAARDEKDLP